MRVLHLEDSTTKYMDIKSVLRSVGIVDVVWEESVEAGMKHLEHPEEAFDLVISDMHFPVDINGTADEEAGEILLKKMREKGIRIPVIIISSLSIHISEAYKCIWYVDSRDWETELRNCIKELMSQK